MEEQRALREALKVTDTSLIFFRLLIFGILLSFWSVLIQRDQLCSALSGGDPSPCPSVYPLKHAAGGITVGCLGFFLCLAFQTWRSACQGSDPEARRSAQVNLWASILVLSAAILRLENLEFTAGSGQSSSLEEGDLPA